MSSKTTEPTAQVDAIVMCLSDRNAMASLVMKQTGLSPEWSERVAECLCGFHFDECFAAARRTVAIDV